MEYELRFYYSYDKLEELLNKLKKEKELTMGFRSYEKTMQFDNPNPSYSFYTKEIDGRFRIRVTKNDNESKCKISWKRRITSTTSTAVNKEEEVELDIKYDDYDNLMFLINNVLKMKDIESYERYRTIFTNNDIEISIDEYPFGVALEIENKSTTKDPEEVVKEWVKKLGLNLNDSFRLSWDDKYSQLCKEQNIKQYNHVIFDLPMPKIID